MAVVSVEKILGGFSRLHVSTDDDVIVEEVVADVAPIIDMNKRLQSGDIPKEKFNFGPYGRHVASIPLVMAHHWKQAYGVDVMNPAHNKRVLALLNDPDWKYMKTVDEVL